MVQCICDSGVLSSIDPTQKEERESTRATARGPGDRYLLGRGHGFAFILVLVVMGLQFVLGSMKQLGYEDSAIGSLRTINSAHREYAQTHPDKGFVASLSELGPPPGSALIDLVHVSGNRNGYVITLIAPHPDALGRIAKYVVIARPRRVSKVPGNSFFTDESGIVLYTAESRAPTAQDPGL